MFTLSTCDRIGLFSRTVRKIVGADSSTNSTLPNSVDSASQ